LQIGYFRASASLSMFHLSKQQSTAFRFRRFRNSLTRDVFLGFLNFKKKSIFYSWIYIFDHFSVKKSLFWDFRDNQFLGQMRQGVKLKKKTHNLWVTSGFLIFKFVKNYINVEFQ